MSTQSILQKKDSDLYQEIDELLADSSFNYLLKSRFKVGDGVDIDTMCAILTLQDIICSSLCEYEEYKCKARDLLKCLLLKYGKV